LSGGHLVHVLTGKKTWHTAEGVFAANPGDSVFFKKGAAIVEQHLEVDFCLLMFFIPDDLVRSTVREIAGSLGTARSSGTPIQSAVRVVNDTALSAFFASMRTYFAGKEMPSEPLLRLKVTTTALRSKAPGGRHLCRYEMTKTDSSSMRSGIFRPDGA
jgi:hypothetical protein